MSHRINVMVTDATWEALQSIPRGDRSRFIEEAVLKQFERRRRLDAVSAIDKIRSKMQPVTGRSEDWIREDRKGH